jgi:hypothetical protein
MVKFRVVGGNTSKPGSFPSAALLGNLIVRSVLNRLTGQREVIEKLYYYCGGSLISRWRILCQLGSLALFYNLHKVVFVHTGI